MGIWQPYEQEQAAGARTRPAEPGAGAAATMGEAAEQSRVTFDLPALGPILENDECRNRGVCHPAQVTRDQWREPRLHIEAAERILHVAQGGLDFDDQQDALDGLEGQDVVSSPISEMIEADLHSNEPASRFKERGDRFLERGVISIQQAVQLFASPDDLQAQMRVEAGHDAAHCPDGDACQIVVLHARDG
jgi:hypothetical protein